jgi:multiple RNA-binding domain-containing protein 1
LGDEIPKKNDDNPPWLKPPPSRNIMASSRVFVKGLPPTISEEEFRKHFNARRDITDAKLIPHRRIGYVGYKTPEEAAKAVKYFNKSFIKMSRIGVELARPVSVCDFE